MKKNKKYLIGPFVQIVTFEDAPIKGALSDSDIQVLTGWIAIDEGQILEIGSRDDLISKYSIEEVKTLEGDHIAMPGYVDCHTHICFAGTRANDFAMRNAGLSYLDIAKAGGGIWDSVTQTRKATLNELTAGVKLRADKLFKRGVTTIEVKSGYGLSVEEEIKMLKAIKSAGKKTKSELIPTCLAAHIKPKDYLGTHAQYLASMATELFPELKSQNLCNRIDAFIEEEAFSEEVVQSYFEAAKFMGFDLTVHADQFHPGGSAVAVKHQALSADHLEASGPQEIEMLAKSDVIAVALPGASVGIGCAFTPARKILDAGGALAIASDWNPGSAPMGNLITQASIIGTFQKLTNAEVLAGVTFRAAAALNLHDRGRIVKGFKADIAIYKTNHFNEILYQQGELNPVLVVKGF